MPNVGAHHFLCAMSDSALTAEDRQTLIDQQTQACADVGLQAIKRSDGFYPNAVDTSERAILAREVSTVIEAKVQQGVEARSSAYG